ncbi:MAG: hypothetical protein AB1578_04540 [Thermodesulfobacteriota bacterium]
MREGKGRYHLGRVHKIGRLNDELIVAAIEHPATIQGARYAWTFTDAVVEREGNATRYAYAHLSKFLPEGTVTVVDEPHRAQDQRPEPNLLVATSPFVYIPEFSGIAFLHVWNQIETKAFIKRFCHIICSTHDRFFVGCDIEPISDLRTFVARLKAIDVFLEISAKVHPPNPLFGRAWRRLNEYIQKRNAGELDIKEKSEEGSHLRTDVLEHVQGILAATAQHPYEPVAPIDITDAALLMAADGYGKGKIVGTEGETRVVVRTSDTERGFIYHKVPDPEGLYQEARKNFTAVSVERKMSHE